MFFSESKFREIMSSLRSDGEHRNEKRRWPRVGVGARGRVLVHATRRLMNVFVRDVSLGGIAITSDQKLPVGGHFSLVFTEPTGKSSHVLYEVCRCVHASEAIYDIGAKLVATPGEAAANEAAPAPAAKTAPAPVPAPAAG